MQITTFNPMILSKDADEIIKLFEALGFERRHKVDNIDGKDISSVRMRYTGEDDKVFHVDVARVESMPQDMTTMRMNVRDRGEDHTVESKSARSCLMIAPSGFSIQLTQHIRNHD